MSADEGRDHVGLEDVQIRVRTFLTELDAAPSEPTLYPDVADAEPSEHADDDERGAVITGDDAGRQTTTGQLYAKDDFAET